MDDGDGSHFHQTNADKLWGLIMSQVKELSPNLGCFSDAMTKCKSSISRPALILTLSDYISKWRDRTKSEARDFSKGLAE